MGREPQRQQGAGLCLSSPTPKPSHLPGFTGNRLPDGTDPKAGAPYPAVRVPLALGHAAQFPRHWNHSGKGRASLMARHQQATMPRMPRARLSLGTQQGRKGAQTSSPAEGGSVCASAVCSRLLCQVLTASWVLMLDRFALKRLKGGRPVAQSQSAGKNTEVPEHTWRLARSSLHCSELSCPHTHTRVCSVSPKPLNAFRPPALPECSSRDHCRAIRQGPCQEASRDPKG